ncbi:MAG: TlpA family protein disulfide reductase [Bacteroidia bacterium]
MKKTTILIAMAMLCLNFWARAQAIDVTTKGLQIGQKLPDVTLTNLYNYKDSSGRPVKTAKLADFQGKLLILDFWATWCAPCVAAIPKLEKLQQQFNGKLQILPVTYQSEKAAMPVLTSLQQQKRIEGSLPNVFGETGLHKLFPHVYLPHYVWINDKGVVVAITDGKPINEQEINKVLNQNYNDLVKKKDYKLELDKKKPLFIDGNGGDGATMVYHSMLSTYVPGIGAGFSINPPTEGTVGFSKFLARNVGVMRLFNVAIAAGKMQLLASRTLYETKDSLLIDPLRMGDNWKNLSWTYELSLPQNLQANGYEIMHNELLKFFPQYDVKLEKRKTLCFALRQLPGKSIIPSEGGEQVLNQNATALRMRNATLNLFINALDVYYYSTSKIPIVNLVKDRTLTDLIINAPLSNPEAINLELTKYGLELVKGEFEIDMIVYRDSVKIH